MLKFGYKASAEQFGPNELLEFSSTAEDVGLDSVFVSDHFQPWKHTDGHARPRFRGSEPGSTDETHCHRHQRDDAYVSLSPIDRGAGLRDFGGHVSGACRAGAGQRRTVNDVPALGFKWPGFKERTARLLEAITLIRRLWVEERVTFEGKFYKTEKATIDDRPSTPVPVYLAASGPTVAKMAGEVAEGYICTSGKAPELYRETLLPNNVSAGLQAAGRAPDSIDRMIEMKVSFDTDRQRALEDTREWAALALSAEEKVSVEDPVEMEAHAMLPIERAASRWIVSTDPDEHVARIEQYMDLGFLLTAFNAPGRDQNRFLRLYGKQVLPRLRALG